MREKLPQTVPRADRDADWLIAWLIYWFTVWLIDETLIAWLLYWLITLLIDWLIYWSIDWLIDLFIDWITLQLIDYMQANRHYTGDRRTATPSPRRSTAKRSSLTRATSCPTMPRCSYAWTVWKQFLKANSLQLTRTSSSSARRSRPSTCLPTPTRASTEPSSRWTRRQAARSRKMSTKFRLFIFCLT